MLWTIDRSGSIASTLDRYLVILLPLAGRGVTGMGGETTEIDARQSEALSPSKGFETVRSLQPSIGKDFQRVCLS
ncbi:MAG: hypothetical protein D6728_18525 [Cyanobacteria bacterium J055]|nr:MAG: hypothetical protein D6728_18525 [Cyanobacteria bacterium J055]